MIFRNKILASKKIHTVERKEEITRELLIFGCVDKVYEDLC